ncbi:helix-turn-helix domain-containing protein [Phytohabitans sp. ZYX-F-186]|uniref:Helix-turn-helix domain-containing protein n=1 Tax=Phytohabitans maris TaxID=3071409 RepID=A0ABU0ZQM0_9ACTN|nr:helix-turn-helix domain-containing protein [Phytohabitans sp. ZYX-F-186]MDQ7909333.1 helix-turn-helix domain-containing protein [Phytohabitans sp. ZYX-F-186]
MANLDLLMHPVRLRIIQALLDRRPSTTTQLRARLPDIPPATMYRHIAALTTAGVLEILDERRIRGAVERTYRLRWDRTELDPTERAAMTADDHRRAFTAFTGGLLADFDRYLTRGPADPTTDGITYRQAALWLTDTELAELLTELRSAITARTRNDPGQDRTRRMISVVVIPTEN